MKILITIPVLVITVGVATVVILDKIAPQKSSNNITTSVVIAKPSEIIKQYQTAGKIQSLDTLYSKRESPLVGPEVINYTTKDSYMVYIKPTDSVQYEQKDKSITTNSTAIKSNSESFLGINHLNKMSITAKGTPFSVYDSEKTVCQLFDSPSFKQNGAMLTLSCVNKSIINEQYTTINKLLGLYTGNKSAIATPTGIIVRSSKEDNKILSVLNIYGAKTESGAISLIFAAIDNKWEYIGERSISNGDAFVDNSISAALKTRLNDAKYQGFLNKYVK